MTIFLQRAAHKQHQFYVAIESYVPCSTKGRQELAVVAGDVIWVYCTFSTQSLNQLILAALVRHLSSPSLVHPHLPLSKSQIALSGMHLPVFGIIFRLHSVNLVHHLSPPSVTPSITFSLFHSRLKTHLFHKSFPP